MNLVAGPAYLYRMCDHGRAGHERKTATLNAQLRTVINEIKGGHCASRTIDPSCPLCYICPMIEDKGSLNLRGVPVSLIRRAKAAAALEGKTLRIWAIEALQEKIRKVK